MHTRMSEQRIETSISHAAYRLGYSDIRLHQMQAVKHVMQGNDVFFSLPTGSGKSLIYAVLPFAYDELLGSEGSIVIVVSPLLSLMKDQLSKRVCVRPCVCMCVFVRVCVRVFSPEGM